MVKKGKWYLFLDNVDNILLLDNFVYYNIMFINM